MRKLVAAALVFVSLGLSACGFTPLYATPGVSPTLASIDVVVPDGRSAYLLREHLDDAMAHDLSVPAAYRLELTIDEARYPRGVRVDNVANRYELRLTANYKLVEKASGGVIRTGVAQATVSYDSADQPYAGIAAQQDGQDRAAAEVARKIQIDLASWLARQSG